MRIVVNDIAASSGGALSILKDFYNFILESDKENKWIFLLSDIYFEETENIRVITLQNVKKSWLNKLKFDLINGKEYIRNLNPDVVLSMQNIITFGLKIPQIVYIHQSIPFQNLKKFSFFKSTERILAIYQYIIGRLIIISAKKADKVIVQTDWMKEALCNKAKINYSKVIRIYPNISDYSRYKKNNEFSNKSFFCPTSNIIYKNNDCIYKANLLLNQKGKRNFNIKMTIQSNNRFSNIQFIGKISREEVIKEYNQSTLILSSYIESFPLPLEEAKQMGTIILASDCEFSKEILEGYKNAYYFNPFRPEELANLMEKVLDGHIIRKDTEPQINKDKAWKIVVKEVTDSYKFSL